MSFPGSASRIPARISTLAPRWFRPAGILVALTLVVALGLARSAAADTFPVTNTADKGPGSLRAAMEAAELHAGFDSIPISATGIIDLQSALPTIADPVQIAGPGPEKLTIRRGISVAFRIFTVANTVANLSGMKLTNGLTQEGGAINSIGSLTLVRMAVIGNEALARGGAKVEAQGGGILSNGPLVMRESSVTKNLVFAAEGTTSSVARYAGVGAFEETTIESSTISENTAEASSVTGRVSAVGGGVFIEGVGNTTITNSTISDNSAVTTGNTDGVAAAGGIGGEDPLTITGSTITGNSLHANDDFSGANSDLLRGVLVRDTIFSNAIGNGTSCGGPLISQGYNIEDGVGCGFTQPTDLSKTDPGLDPKLADNGGPTPTHALLPGSVAIDRGNAFGAKADQRGLARPSDLLAVPNLGGDGADVGAFELQAPAPPPPPAPAMDRIAPNTRIGHGPRRQTQVPLAVFRFSSTEAGSRFECKLDRAKFRPCRSPFKRRVRAAARRGARHVFLVRAIDGAGNVDSTPAKFVWRVTKKR